MRSTLVVSAAVQTAPPDKLLNPPRCGGTSKRSPSLRSAARCLRSLSRETPFIAKEFPAEDTLFIGKSDRLLTGEGFQFLVQHGPPFEADAGELGQVDVAVAYLDAVGESPERLEEVGVRLVPAEAEAGRDVE